MKMLKKALAVFKKRRTDSDYLREYLDLIEELALKEIELCKTEQEIMSARKFWLGKTKKMNKELWSKKGTKK
jgi:hypothetical protein